MNSKDETDRELVRRFAMQTVEDALRDLATNVLRTIRGAGRPHTILPQVQALMDAARSYRGQVGQFPAPEVLGKALEIDTPAEKLDQMSPETEAIVTARERILHLAPNRRPIAIRRPRGDDRNIWYVRTLRHHHAT